MSWNSEFHRRGLLKFGASLALGSEFLGVESAMSQSALTGTREAGSLPSQGEFIVRGGHVLSMDPTIGDFTSGDVHVRSGEIVSLGTNIAAPEAQEIDAREMIVMPGFIDTHWHLWCTPLRLIVRADDPKEGYFPTTIRVGRHCTPEDAYIGVRLGVAEGLLVGGCNQG